MAVDSFLKCPAAEKPHEILGLVQGFRAETQGLGFDTASTVQPGFTDVIFMWEGLLSHRIYAGLTNTNTNLSK